jgi:hypothetical protein
MVWITNTTKCAAFDWITELCRGWQGRKLVVNEPKSTEAYSAAQLRLIGVVGIYEIAPGRRVETVS